MDKLTVAVLICLVIGFVFGLGSGYMFGLSQNFEQQKEQVMAYVKTVCTQEQLYGNQDYDFNATDFTP